MWSFIVNVPCLTTLLFDFTIFAFYWTKINIKWNWNRFLRSFVQCSLSLNCQYLERYRWVEHLLFISEIIFMESCIANVLKGTANILFIWCVSTDFHFPRKNKSNAFQLANNLHVVIAELYWNTVFDLVLLRSRYFINSNKVCEKCRIGGETIFCRNTKCNDIENYLLAFVWKIQRALLKQT